MVFLRRDGSHPFAILGCAACAVVMGACSSHRSTTANDSDPWFYYQDHDGVVVREQPGTTRATTATPVATPAARTSHGWPAAHPDSNLRWTAMAFPTGDPATSAIGLEKGVPRQVRLDQPFDYEIWVTNLTDMSLRDVVVSDSMGGGFEFDSATPSGRDDTAGEMSWRIGDMAPREVKVIKVTGTPTREGEVAMCAIATYDSFLCTQVPVVAPQLALTKSGPAEAALVCDVVELKYEVANTGTGTLQNVTVTDTLPRGVTTVDGRNSVSFTAPTLASGQKVPFTVKVKANGKGTYESGAMAQASGLSAESSSRSIKFVEPVLTVERTCRETQYLGLPLEAEITVKNTGDGPAKDLVIEDMAPTNATFVSASNSGALAGEKVVWNLGTLAPGASTTVTVRYNPEGLGTYPGTTFAKAYCAKTVNDGCQTVVSGVPALLLETVDDPDPIQIDGQTTYTITVTNQGSKNDSNIKIVCELEDTQAYVSSSGATRGTATGNRIEFAPIATLAPGATAEFKVTVRGVKTGDTRFRTTMTSDFLTRPVEETESTNIYRLR